MHPRANFAHFNGCDMIQTANISLQELFDRYYRPRRLLGRSEKTAYQYGIQFRHFAKFLGRDATTADLDDDVIAAFLQWYADGRDRKNRRRSPETANKARSHLLAIWRFANSTGRVQRGPTVDSFPVPESAPTAWTAAEIGRILDACRRLRGFIAEIPTADYFTAMHYWWLCGGERTGATFALEWPWVDLSNAVAVVPGRVRKDASTLAYSLSPECVDSLRKIIIPTREKVFPWPWHIHTFWNRYRKLIESAGLPTKGAGPQKMRRSFASHLTAAGGDATKALHHSNRSLTVRSYIDPRIAKPAEHWRVMPRFAVEKL